MKKRISDWVIDLDSELSVSVASSQVTNRKRTSSSTALNRYPSNSKRKKATPITRKTSQSNITPLPVSGDSETVWNVKYAPKSTSDLAVHKKKVTEVQQWLEVALSHRTQRPILLLTGPSGCGKTATVHALSLELGVSIVEWSNPLDVLPVGVVDRQAQTRDYEFQESQTKQFLNFLIRGNKYPSLQFSLSSHSELKEDRERGGRGGGEERKSKIVLIEDFPNAILRDPSQLHHLLRSMKRFSYPLIFIVSESQSSGSSRLFPLLITSELDIYNINFNPVAHTNMIKALQRITETEFKSKTGSGGRASKTTPTTIPNKEMIESIAEKSNGDIRFAVNMLQFSCLRGDKCKSSDYSGEVGVIKRVGPSEQGRVEGRDSSMFLFRALGKILYCKRGNIEGVVDSTSSQASLRSTETRGKLLIEPEAIFESVNMRSELFCLYLHQNYLDFFEKIEDVAVALEYLSDSDVLSSIWTDSQVDRRCLESCSSSVCCRGLLYANTEVSTSKWRPLHKPQWNQVWRKFEDNCATVRGLFLHLGASPHSHLWLPVELQTEILPFISLLNKPLRNINQANLLHAVTDFRQTFKRQSSKLGETEFGDETSHAYSLSQTPSIEKQLHGSESESKSTVTGSQLSGTITSDQEEINDIEDFDDDDKW